MACIIILLHGIIENYPIVIAGNRDEVLERASSGPEVIENAIRIYGPRDKKAGGLYIAVNNLGVVASLTNKVSDVSGEGFKSRGLLVLEALRGKDLREVESIVMSEINRNRYNDFNLLYCDRNGARVIYYRDGRLTGPERLDKGIHVLTHGHVNDTGDLRTKRAFSLLSGIEELYINEAMERLKDICSNHEMEICIREGRVRTLDTNIFAVHQDLKDNRYLHMDRLHSDQYKNYSHLF